MYYVPGKSSCVLRKSVLQYLCRELARSSMYPPQQKRTPGESTPLRGSVLGLAAPAVTVQPFADVVAGDACRDRHKKADEDIQSIHLPSVASIGGQRENYIKIRQEPQGPGGLQKYVFQSSKIWFTKPLRGVTITIAEPPGPAGRLWLSKKIDSQSKFSEPAGSSENLKFKWRRTPLPGLSPRQMPPQAAAALRNAPAGAAAHTLPSRRKEKP